MPKSRAFSLGTWPSPKSDGLSFLDLTDILFARNAATRARTRCGSEDASARRQVEDFEHLFLASPSSDLPLTPPHPPAQIHHVTDSDLLPNGPPQFGSANNQKMESLTSTV